MGKVSWIGRLAELLQGCTNYKTGSVRRCLEYQSVGNRSVVNRSVVNRPVDNKFKAGQSGLHDEPACCCRG